MEFIKFIKEWYQMISEESEMINVIKDFKVDFENQQIIINLKEEADPEDTELYCPLGDWLSIIPDHNYAIFATPVNHRYVIKDSSCDDNGSCPPDNIKCVQEMHKYIFNINGIRIEINTYDDLFLYDKEKFAKVIKKYLENHVDAIGVYFDSIILYKESDGRSLVNFIKIHRDDHDIIKDYPEFSQHYVYERYDDNYKKLKELVVDYIINLIKGSGNGTNV